MHHHKIPHGRRCGIFSTLTWWLVFQSVNLAGQALPRLAIPPPEGHSNAFLTVPTDSLTILALRVAFTLDDNVSTTGDGHFLTTVETSFCDGFLVDKPPHDVPYFQDQLQAVANYFEQVSWRKVTFDLPGSLVYPSSGADPIVLDRPMAGYRPVANDDSSDALLVQLLAESLAAAVIDGLDPMAYDIVVVFHAGLGQDFTYAGLDPTPLDIPSAFIDGDMIRAALDTTGIPLPDGSLFTHPGILLPEGQNHIFYDIAEDIFFGQQDLCDVQVGLTGTFALLLGYALGYPPLFDIEAGETGVGVFGLMDIGSNNGRGVIPAPPTAWTRVRLDWEQAVELEGDISLAARHLGVGQIGRIRLSTDEVLLVENRLNWVLPDVDMDNLRYRNRYAVSPGDTILPPYFDYLVDSTGVEVAASGVITSVPNYDIGLPGSGLLIWHVDASRVGPTAQGINNDRNARAVALMEADGAVDIGFPTTLLTNDLVQGWRWDLWYAGNEVFFLANPDRRANNPQGLLSLDDDTFPSTALNSGAASGVALYNMGPAGGTLSFAVEDVATITRLPEGSRLLGFNGQDWIYALGDSLWLGDQWIALLSDSIPSVIISEHDAVSIPGAGFWGLTLLDPGYLAQRYLPGGGALDTLIQDTVRVATIGVVPSIHPHFDAGKLTLWVEDDPVPQPPDTTRIRYLASPLSLIDIVPYRQVSKGDIDGDGIDEGVEVYEQVEAYDQVPGTLTARNDNNIVLDGFPVEGDFKGVALIANLTGDIRPELVVVESGDIAIYSPEGRLLSRLGLHADPADLFLMHMDDGRVGLANGDRLHWFEPDKQNPQWVTPQGRHSRSRYSLNDGIVKIAQPKVLDRTRVYNYPNPVTGGRTRIRFYTGEASRATIRIYTIDGLPVDQVELTNLATNDYNEWLWEVGDNPSGLYYAVVEVQGAEKVSALVKIAVVR